MDWDKLRIFHAVAHAGSFSRAAEEISLSQSAVSRQIRGLEEDLRIHLFHRHARGLNLTDQGELLLRTVEEMFSRLSVTEAVLREGRDEPRGEIWVAATVVFGSTWLTPRMHRFLDKYPDMRATLILDDQELDLPLQRADMAICMRAPREEGLIRLKLATVGYRLYTTQAYLASRNVPKMAADLDQHAIIAYSDDPPAPMQDINWALWVGRVNGATPRSPVLRVNNLYGVMLALESGLGIGGLPDYLGSGNPKLVPVLPDLNSPEYEIHLVYPEELRNFRRIQAFRDFLVDEVAAIAN